MWALDSTLTSVKTKKGEPLGKRQSVERPISSASASRRAERALYSFAISLLPFFKPSKTDMTELESLESPTNFDDGKAYIATLKKYPIFPALAHYCIMIKYKVETKIRTPFAEMADHFQALKEPPETEESGPVLEIKRHLKLFLPQILTEQKDVVHQITKSEAKEMAEELVNYALISWTKTHNSDFAVLNRLIIYG